MADVFISYSREDRALVRRLADAVTREGYSLWWDDELPPHRAYGDVITEQIGAAKAAIVVWSQSAAASEWVRAEADVARSQKKLIQVSIDERMPPLPFNQLHFVSIGDWKGEPDHPGWRKVRESLEALCGAGNAASAHHPMPTRPPPNRARTIFVAIVVLCVLAILAAAALAWMRADLPEPAAPPAKAFDAPPPRRAPPQARRTAEPRPAATPGPRAVRRYCLGPGRGSPECRRLRQRRAQGR